MCSTHKGGKGGKLSGAQLLQGGPMKASNNHVHPNVSIDNQILFWTKEKKIIYWNKKWTFYLFLLKKWPVS